jgi:hypothetical protein
VRKSVVILDDFTGLHILTWSSWITLWQWNYDMLAMAAVKTRK